MNDKAGMAKQAAKNRKAYVKEREKQDRILLRLAKGEAKELDQACSHAGLSRSKFASKYLIPWLRSFASSNRQASASVERLMPIQPMPPQTAKVADEFDTLFQSDQS